MSICLDQSLKSNFRSINPSGKYFPPLIDLQLDDSASIDSIIKDETDESAYINEGKFIKFSWTIIKNKLISQ